MNSNVSVSLSSPLLAPILCWLFDTSQCFFFSSYPPLSFDCEHVEVYTKFERSTDPRTCGTLLSFAASQLRAPVCLLVCLFIRSGLIQCSTAMDRNVNE